MKVEAKVISIKTLPNGPRTEWTKSILVQVNSQYLTLTYTRYLLSNNKWRSILKFESPLVREHPDYKEIRQAVISAVREYQLRALLDIMIQSSTPATPDSSYTVRGIPIDEL